MHYIGSSFYPVRLSQHRNLLNKNKHVNYKLQNYFNKYTINEFVCGIVTIIPEDILEYRETIENAYIKHFDAFKNGFNLLEFADLKSLSDRSKKALTGVPLCKQHRSNISDSLRKRKGVIILLDKNNTRYEVNNYAEFGREHNINATNISAVVNGITKSCKGFRLEETPFIEKEHTFISPDGETITNTIPNLCKKYKNIRSSGMHSLRKGKFNYYKGWCRPDMIINRGARSATKVTLESPRGEIRTENSIEDFCKKYKLSRSMIRRVIDGKFPHTKGWKIPVPVIEPEYYI